MASNITLTMIKPDAVAAGHSGKIIDMIIQAGFKVQAMKLTRLSTEKAQEFYAVHSARPFFGELVSFMTSGPVLMMCLTGENAVLKNREIMGATDPAKAVAGTIRKDFADSIEANAVHGSDSPNSAEREIAYFFDKAEVQKRF